MNIYRDGKVWHECYCKKEYPCQACTSGNSWACSTANDDEDANMCNECLERFAEEASEYEDNYMRDVESRGYRSGKLFLLDCIDWLDRSWFPWAVLAIFSLVLTMITYDDNTWSVVNLTCAVFTFTFLGMSVKRM